MHQHTERCAPVIAHWLWYTRSASKRTRHAAWTCTYLHSVQGAELLGAAVVAAGVDRDAPVSNLGTLQSARCKHPHAPGAHRPHAQRMVSNVASYDASASTFCSFAHMSLAPGGVPRWGLSVCEQLQGAPGVQAGSEARLSRNKRRVLLCSKQAPQKWGCQFVSSCRARLVVRQQGMPHHEEHISQRCCAANRDRACKPPTRYLIRPSGSFKYCASGR